MAKTLNDYSEQIRECRVKIADLKRDKINMRASAWESATGIADQKKDYVRSIVSDKDCEIDKLEAEIEYYYNLMRIEYE